MVTAETRRNIVGIVGNVISLGLFLSPVPTFHKIWKNKTVGGFSPIPYLISLLNCVMWVFYGVLRPDRIPVLSINGAGAALELLYVAVFLRYATPLGRATVLHLLAVELVFMAAATMVLMGIIVRDQSREIAAGIMCAVLGVLMYASPLVATWQVVKTKSVRFMPFWLSLASFLNGACWLAYAALQFDFFIMVPNGLGVILGLMQLLLYGLYYSSTPTPADEAAGAEVQVTTAAAVVALQDGRADLRV